MPVLLLQSNNCNRDGPEIGGISNKGVCVLNQFKEKQNEELQVLNLNRSGILCMYRILKMLWLLRRRP